MPRLQVDGEASLSLSSALVNIAGCIIKIAQHRYNPITRSICGGSELCEADIDALLCLEAGIEDGYLLFADARTGYGTEIHD